MSSSPIGQTLAPFPALDSPPPFAYLGPITHAGVRDARAEIPARFRSGPQIQFAWKRGFGLRRRTGRRSSILAPSRLFHASAGLEAAPTSATRPTAGTRRWNATSSARGPTSTSSTSRRACRSCTSAGQVARWGLCGGAVRRHKAARRRASGHGRAPLRASIREPPWLGGS